MSRKQKNIGYVSAVAMIALFLVSYLINKNNLLVSSETVKQGTGFCRLVAGLFSGMRGLVVDNVKAECQPDGRVKVSWTPVQGKVALYEVFRSRKPFYSQSDIRKNGYKIGAVGSGGGVLFDTPLQEGNYFYTVVVRNEHGFYPVVPGRNSMKSAVSVFYKGIVHKINARAMYAESAEGSGVMLRWKKSSVPFDGYQIYRSRKIVYNQARLKKATLIAVVSAGVRSFRDNVKSDGHFYYAVFPIGGKRIFSAGANVTMQPVTIGMPEAGHETLTTVLKKSRLRNGFAARNLYSQLKEVKFKEELRNRIRSLVEAVYSRFPEKIVEVTFYYGDECFYSTDTVKGRHPRRKYHSYSSIYLRRLFGKRLIDVQYVPRSTEHKRVRFVCALTAESKRAFVLEMTMKVEKTKSALSYIILLIVFAFFSGTLYNLYVRYARGFYIGFALLFLCVFVFVGVFFLQEDLLARSGRSIADTQKFYNYSVKSARRSGAYREYGSVGWQRIADQMLIDRNGGKSFSFLEGKGRALDENGDVVFIFAEEKGWYSQAVIFLVVLSLLVFLGVAIPLFLWGVRGGITRFFVRVRSHRIAWFFILPVLLALLLFWGGPLLMMFAASFAELPAFFESFELDIVQRFVGFKNYFSLFGLGQATSGFWAVLRNTVLYTVSVLFFQVLVGVGAAILLHYNSRQESLRKLRFVFILPWALPSYIGALVFGTIFSPQESGFVNQVLSLLGGTSVDWAHSFSAGLSVMVIATVWFGFPFIMVAALGALENINPELYGVADMDGCTAYRRLWHVVLPAIRPAVISAAALSGAWTFNNLNYVYMINKGWQETDVLVSRFFSLLTKGETSVGYGYLAAFSVITMAIIWLYVRALHRVGRTGLRKIWGN